MVALRLARRLAEAAVPDRAVRYAEDVARGVRFDYNARAYRQRYGFQPAERTLTVLAYPEAITTHPRILFNRLSAALGYHVTAIPSRPHDVAVKFHDATYTDPAVLAPLGARPVINGNSLDISKSRVNRAFVEAFGVNSFVDPETHVGPMVEKPDLNSKRGLGVIQGPAPAREGFVYQKLVDSTTGDGRYVELRLAYHDGRFPLAYKKEIDVATRFRKVHARVTVETPTEHFSADELARVALMCQAMGIDFGEIDTLRDKADGQVYVVDIDNTPYGPVKELTEAGHEQAVRLLAASFQQMCESRLDR